MDDNFLTSRDPFEILDGIKANDDKIKNLHDQIEALQYDNQWKREALRLQLQRKMQGV